MTPGLRAAAGPDAVRTHLLQLLSYAALSTSALVVPLYARDLGASYETIGLIGAATGVAGVLSNVVFGRLGDRTDRRLLLAAGFAGAAAAYALQLLARDPASLLAARFLVGFASGVIPATLVAYVYEVRRPLGKFTSYNALGWLLGSGLLVAAGALPDLVFRVGLLERARQALLSAGVYGLLFAASAALSALGWFLTRRLPPMRVRIDVPLFPARLLAANAHVYLSLFLRHLGATAIWTIYPLYVVELGGDLALVGWLHVVNMVAQIAVLRAADRHARLAHPRFLVAAGLALSALVFASFTLVDRAAALLPLQLVVGVSFAALWLGSLKEVLDQNVERATASGLLNAAMSLSNVVGPLLGGLVAHRYGFRAVMLAGSAVTALALGLYAWMARARPLRPVPVPVPAFPRPAGEVAP